jgi:hypothetical protein
MAPAPPVRLWVPALIFLVLLMPLALTPMIPAVDFNDHLLRYWILADNGATPFLADHYSPRWALLSNLGMDIIGTGTLKLLPPLAAGKLLAALVLLAPVLGALYLAHAVQGRITLFTCLLAATLGFNHIFTWGFANFLLGMGLLLFGLGWWIRMAQRPGLQLGGAILIGAVLIVVHALAFGLWGLLLGCVELMLALAAGRPTLGNLALRAARLVSIAVLPALYFLSSRTAEAPEGVTAAAGNLGAHAQRGNLMNRVLEEALSRVDLLLMVSDSINPWPDRLIGGLMWALLLSGLAIGTLRLAPVMRLAAALAFVLVLILPPNLFGSGYTNDRMPLLLMALLVGGLTLVGTHPRARALTAGVGLLLAAHLALVTSSYLRAGRHFRDYMAQTQPLQLGAIAAPLHFRGAGRLEHLPFCSGLLPMLTFTKGVAVPTFAIPSQQPLVTVGALDAAVSARIRGNPRSERIKYMDGAPVAERQARIASQFGYGFDTIVACDGDGPVPSSDRIERVAAGPFWGVYRAKPAPLPLTTSASARP